MPKPSWSGDVSRKIVRRIVVEGDLVLQTPAHFGNGDGSDLVSMPLLTDSFEDKTPLLTGASIAGALRSYLWERQHGFRAKDTTDPDSIAPPGSASVLLFGGGKGQKYGEQSPLIIEDALGTKVDIELRDGVSLVGGSRTAAEEKLFTIEMWEAGTTFPLRFELIVRQGDDPMALKQALATALAGFTDGSITLGARKRRGYGRVNVSGWRSREYDLTKSAKLLDWIAIGAERLSVPTSADIVQALGVGGMTPDQRHAFRLNAQFFLDGSLLIRSGSGPDIEQAATNGSAGQQPDTVHLHSTQAVTSPDGKRQRAPIVSSTSLTGALRSRALKIARLIASSGAGEQVASSVIDDMFGTDKGSDGKPQASRVRVCESRVENVENKLVQTRMSLDRFTGGARDGALFSEQPLFSKSTSLITVDLHLENPQAHEIGLFLLLLKDLWTRDLPLGGEIAIGRGRLRGKSCDLEHRNGQVKSWHLEAKESNGVHMTKGELGELEYYVAALHQHLSRSIP